MKRLFVFIVFVVVHTYSTPPGEGIYDDMFWASRQRTYVHEFSTRDELAKFLANTPEGYMGSIRVYKGEPVEYTVEVKTKDRRREIVESVEIGREVKFMDQEVKP